MDVNLSQSGKELIENGREKALWPNVGRPNSKMANQIPLLPSVLLGQRLAYDNLKYIIALLLLTF